MPAIQPYIAVPVNDTIFVDTTISLWGLMATSPVAAMDFHRGSCLPQQRQRAVTRFLSDPSLTHLLFIDSDMVFPRDALIRLLERNVDVVAVDYRKRRHPFDKTAILLPKDPPTSGMVPALRLATGFMLIRRRVLTTLSLPHFTQSWDGEDNITEDIHFCNLCREQGVTLWCDLDLSREVRHLATTGVPYDLPENK